MRFAGLGNIRAVVRSDQADYHLVSHYGTAGHDVRKIGEFRYVWPAKGTLVMASDGLQTHWSLMDYDGLVDRDPALVAAVLYRDHGRGTDDATVVVAREAA